MVDKKSTPATTLARPVRPFAAITAAFSAAGIVGDVPKKPLNKAAIEELLLPTLYRSGFSSMSTCPCRMPIVSKIKTRARGKTAAQNVICPM